MMSTSVWNSRPADASAPGRFRADGVLRARAGVFRVERGRAATVRVRFAMRDYASIRCVDTPESGITFSGFILSLATNRGR